MKLNQPYAQQPQIMTEHDTALEPAETRFLIRPLYWLRGVSLRLFIEAGQLSSGSDSFLTRREEIVEPKFKLPLLNVATQNIAFLLEVLRESTTLLCTETGRKNFSICVVQQNLLRRLWNIERGRLGAFIMSYPKVSQSAVFVH